METFVIFDTHCFGQTIGGALIRVVPLLGIIRYTQKSTTPILALKLSVSAIITPRWTATQVISLNA